MADAIKIADINVINPPTGPHISRIFSWLENTNTASAESSGITRLIANRSCKSLIYLAPIRAFAAPIPDEITSPL